MSRSYPQLPQVCLSLLASLCIVACDETSSSPSGLDCDGAGPSACADDRDAGADADRDASEMTDAAPLDAAVADADLGDLQQPVIDASADAEAAGADADAMADSSVQQPGPDGGQTYLCGSPAPAGNLLLDVGHTSPAVRVRVSGSRAVSEERNGHWVLWNLDNQSHVESGEAKSFTEEGIPGAVELAGSTLAVSNMESPARVDLRDSATGTLLATLPIVVASDVRNFGLARNGSYAWDTVSGGLRVWSRTGELTFQKAGPGFASASIAALPNELLVSNGPAGTNVIERIAVPSAASSLTPTFAGTFHSWFGDAQRFATLSGSALRIYSLDAVQEPVLFVPVDARYGGGYGDYLWLAIASELQLFRVGTSHPIPLPGGPFPANSAFLASGPGVAQGSGDFVLDLRVPALSRRTPASPIFQTSADVRLSNYFAADDSGAWIGSLPTGVITGGTELPAAPRHFGCGMIGGMASSHQGDVAISTSDGLIRIFKVRPEGSTFVRTIPLPVSNGDMSSTGLAMSSDGSKLVAKTQVAVSGMGDRRRIFVLDVETGAELWSTIDAADAFSASDDVATIVTWTCRNETCSLRGYQAGTATPWPPIEFSQRSSNGTFWSSNPVVVSPNGQKIAISAASITVYENGRIVGATAGKLIGWISDSELLMRPDVGDDVVVVNTVGEEVRRFSSLPGNLTRVYPLDAARFYAPYHNAIYSNATGALLWRGAVLQSAQLAGTHVVGTRGPKVLFERWMTP